MNQAVVEFITLDEEHVQTNLKGCVLLDLLNRFYVHCDTIEVVIWVSRNDTAKFLHFLVFFEDKQVIIVDVQCLLGD